MKAHDQAKTRPGEALRDTTAGGHLLGCSMMRARIGLQLIRRLELALPVTFDYLTADLSRDTSKGLHKAEKQGSWTPRRSRVARGFGTGNRATLPPSRNTKKMTGAPDGLHGF
jgi:hypothetical protein